MLEPEALTTLDQGRAADVEASRGLMFSPKPGPEESDRRALP